VRQLLIDIPVDSPLAPGKVSHAQLTEKIKQALATLTKEDTPELEIRSVTQFHNGGTVIEMLTTKAASFLKDQCNKDSFLQALDPGAILKDRSYPVIIQFVPLTFDPSNQEQLHDLEQENKWEEQSITVARWVKPPAKQSSTQRVAHLIITLKDPMIANKGI
jgi:hypothetical protein